jgi:hypothetical protein
MTVILAEKTKAAIEQVQEADQGATFRQFLQKILPTMGDVYRGTEKNPYRNHLGASVIGKSCDRQTWYGFRWFKKPKFPGRIVRLFNRGHLEEARVIASLQTIGVTVYQQDENGKQYRISDAGGHFGGSGDGVAVGIPDLPIGLPCLLEIKTHADKYFKVLLKIGVKLEKPEHYIQMQIYMRKMGLTVALYCAVNKDTDEYYFELVLLDVISADQNITRGVKMVFMQNPPAKINNSPAWFECKFCDYNRICHFGIEYERNCRTCFYSRAIADGTWACVNEVCPGTLSEDEQLAGCAWYEKLC